jgi:A/G-specific adenine glycosylase
MTRWYAAHGRKLPWRETADPYAIWISETMLQQTQVATVLDYYVRFLKQFPNVETLAAADEQEVLRLWAGLGYYRRARQLHAAAKAIVAQFAGQFPENLDEVVSLPGIGRYTAGAITSFAFDARSPIVEANTQRLYSRLLMLQEPTHSTESQKRLWNFADDILPARTGSGRINQAVMELGSQICKPKKPLCHECPVQSLCVTHARGLEAEIPVPKPKKLITQLVHVGVLIQNRGRLLLRRNAPGEWWEGLWDFPRADLASVTSSQGFDQCELSSAANLELVELAMRQTHALTCKLTGHAKTVSHSVTRFRVTLFCFEATMNATAMNATADNELRGDWRWVGESDALPLCAPAQRLRKWVHRL